MKNKNTVEEVAAYKCAYMHCGFIIRDIQSMPEGAHDDRGSVQWRDFPQKNSISQQWPQ